MFKIAEKRSLRWADEMMDDLIKSLQSFKAIMNYRGLDFDGDKTLLYSYVRKDMATIYEPEDVTLFGPVENTIVAAQKQLLLYHLPLHRFDSFTRHLQFPERHATNDLQRCWVKPSNDSGLIPAR